MWNFNSGALLREYVHREGRKEITAVAFLTPQDQQQQQQQEEEQEQERQQQPEEGQRLCEEEQREGGFAEGGSRPASGSGSGTGSDWQRGQQVAGMGGWRGSDGAGEWGKGAALQEQEWDVAGSGVCGGMAGKEQEQEEEEEGGPPSLVS